MKKYFLFALLLFPLLLSNGCASSNAEQKDTNGPAAVVNVSQDSPEPLKLVETGYTIPESSYGGPFVEYGFILNNPNSSIGADFPGVRIIMRDSSGQVIGTTEQVLNRILPNETIAWGGQASPNGKTPATVEFQPYVSDRNWKEMDPASYKPFQISGLNVNDSDFQMTFTGELINTNAKSFDGAAVSVILRDANGKIVAGYSGFPRNVPANGKVPFQVMALGKVPQYTKVEAYAMPWM